MKEEKTEEGQTWKEEEEEENKEDKREQGRRTTFNKSVASHWAEGNR